VTIGQLNFPLTIFYGFNIKVNKINNSKFILWIDPTYVQFLTMDKWIESLGVETPEEILHLIGDICVLPTKRKGKISKIDLKERIPDEIRNYWKNKYNLDLTTKTGMAEISFKQGKPFSYPLETLCFEKKWI